MTMDEAKALQAEAYRIGVYRAGIGRAKEGGHSLIITLAPTTGLHETRARCFSKAASAKAYLGLD